MIDETQPEITTPGNNKTEAFPKSPKESPDKGIKSKNDKIVKEIIKAIKRTKD